MLSFEFNRGGNMKRYAHSLFAMLPLMTLLAGCASVSPASINPQPGKPVRLVLHFDGIESEKGSLLVFVHDNRLSYSMDDDTHEDGFYPFRSIKVKPHSPETTVTFDDIPAGHYVVSAYQDRNDNGRLDRQIIPFTGMPVEPYGFSNNVFDYFSKASFGDAVIAVDYPETELNITVSSHLEKVFSK